MSRKSSEHTTRYELITVGEFQHRIYTIRGVQVMIDNDLAELYGVDIKNLNKAIKRKIDGYPDKYMFTLTWEEYEGTRFQYGTMEMNRSLRSQIVTIKCITNLKSQAVTSSCGGRRTNSYAFTEQRLAMLSAVRE